MEQHRTFDVAGQVIRRLSGVTPWHLNVSTVVGDHGLDVGIDGGSQPGLSAAHAKPGYPNALTIDSWMILQPFHCGVQIGNSFRVAQ